MFNMLNMFSGSDYECPDPNCFFCIMKEQDNEKKGKKLTKYLKEVPTSLKEGHVFLFSSLYNNPMSVYPFVQCGVIESILNILDVSITNSRWINEDQNRYVPFYSIEILTILITTQKHPDFLKIFKKNDGLKIILRCLRFSKYFSWLCIHSIFKFLMAYSSFVYSFEAEKEDVQNLLRYTAFSNDVVYLRFYQWPSRRDWTVDMLSKIYSNRQHMDYNKDKEDETALSFGREIQLSGIVCLDKISSDSLKDSLPLFLKLFNSMFERATNLHFFIHFFGMVLKVLDDSTVEDFLKSTNFFKILDDCCRSALMTTDEFHFLKIINFLISNEKSSKIVLDHIGDSLVHLFPDKNILKKIIGLNYDQKVIKKAKQFSKKKFGKLEEAKHFKDKGNAELVNKNLSKAVEYYSKSIACNPNDESFISICYSNRSECYLRLNKYQLAIEDSTTSIAYNPMNGKSYYRRAKALNEIGKEIFALLDLQKCQKLKMNFGALKSSIEQKLFDKNTLFSEIKYGKKVPEDDDRMGVKKNLPVCHCDDYDDDKIPKIKDTFKYIFSKMNDNSIVKVDKMIKERIEKGIEEKEQVETKNVYEEKMSLLSDPKFIKKSLDKMKKDSSPKETPKKQFCSWCKKEEPNPKDFLLCSVCRKVRYCGKECQLTHWKNGHKKECGNKK
eukprot:gene6893-11055_t